MGVVSAKGKSVPTNRTLPNDAFSLHVLQGLFGDSRPGQSAGEACGSHCFTLTGNCGRRHELECVMTRAADGNELCRLVFAKYKTWRFLHCSTRRRDGDD